MYLCKWASVDVAVKCLNPGLIMGAGAAMAAGEDGSSSDAVCARGFFGLFLVCKCSVLDDVGAAVTVREDGFDSSSSGAARWCTLCEFKMQCSACKLRVFRNRGYLRHGVKSFLAASPEKRAQGYSLFSSLVQVARNCSARP